jgi:flagellar biosynthetic protein FliR
MTASIGGGQVALLFLVLMRCIGLVMTAPIYGHHSIPRLVKIGLAAMLTIALVKSAGSNAGATPLLLAAPLELGIGLALGFILSMGFHAFELAGRVISIQLGLSLGSIFSPTEEEASTAIDPFFSVWSQSEQA